MANLALVTADKIEVVESIIQHTAPAAVAITAGQAVKIDPATGLFSLANASTTVLNRIYGVATKTVPAGLPVTAIRKGVLDGYALTGQAWDLPIHLSDTAGTLADSAGTQPVIVGRVIGAHANVIGQLADKLLLVDL